MDEQCIARGRAVAAILAGAWRHAPGSEPIAPATLQEVLPLVVAGGAAGLAWHRVRQTPLRNTTAGRELQQHYRLQTLQAIDRDRAIYKVLARLRFGGVEPILIKGWSAARLYPEPGLRLSSDLDWCVPLNRLPAAAAALAGWQLPCAVDLHADVPDLPDRNWDQVFTRSRIVQLGERTVRVLGPEDELRLLCLHLARHGIARPLWLCDIGACLESLPADFDWDYCLAGKHHLSSWTKCVLGLATRLLACRRINHAPLQDNVVLWVERAVLWCWGVGRGRRLAYYVRHPVEAVRRMRYHGISPNHGSTPIKAALHLSLGPHAGLPLVGIQLAAFLRRKVPHVLERLVWPRRRLALPFTVHSH
jgi:hypothetical protein